MYTRLNEQPIRKFAGQKFDVMKMVVMYMPLEIFLVISLQPYTVH